MSACEICGRADAEARCAGDYVRIEQEAFVWLHEADALPDGTRMCAGCVEQKASTGEIGIAMRYGSPLVGASGPAKAAMFRSGARKVMAEMGALRGAPDAVDRIVGLARSWTRDAEDPRAVGAVSALVAAVAGHDDVPVEALADAYVRAEAGAYMPASAMMRMLAEEREQRDAER